MKRTHVNDAKLITCQICGREVSGYSMTTHVNHTHKMSAEEYEELYGVYRIGKKRKGTRIVPKHTCEICGNEYSAVGMTCHLRDSHSMKVDEYEKKFNVFISVKRKKYAEQKDTNFTCKLCGEVMISARMLSFHVRKFHKLTNKEYSKKYIFNNIPQYCKCGCGSEVTYLGHPPYKTEYLSGHNSKHSNGMLNHVYTDDTIKKMSKSAILRMNTSSKMNTSTELKFRDWLDSHSINYTQQYPTEFGSVDFHLNDYNLHIEIDGEYWHPLNIENLTFKLLPSTLNDYKKDNNLELIRIRSSLLCKLNDITDPYCLKELHEVRNYDISYYQKILNKDYLKFYLLEKGEGKLRQYIPMLLKFIRTLHPEFPYPEQKESLSYVMKKLQFTDYSHIYVGNEFNHNCSTIGINYLKSNFKSYWSSSFKKSKTPIEAWNDDDIMTKVIEYRVGLNNSNEIFDFSLHQLIRGLSARRYTISFFKPALAKQIYKTILKDKINPTVLDPCMGFGGRLLGFKSAYPNGIYIGCEPNIETYNELIKLRDELELIGCDKDTIQLYNCKFEDLDVSDLQYDICFTSIPYYDTEKYSNDIIHEYKDIEDWKSKFINSFYKLHDCYINLPGELLDDITGIRLFKLKNQTSHYNQGDQSKSEYIVKLLQ